MFYGVSFLAPVPSKTICLLVAYMYVDNLCKQFGHRSGPTLGPDLDPNCLTVMVFLNEIFEKVDFETNQQSTKSMQNYLTQ